MRLKKSIEQKVKEEYPEFFDACQGLFSPEIDIRLAQLARDAEAVAQAQEDDDKLQDAKDEASGLAAPYRDAKKALKLKTRYLIKLQKERA